MMKALKVIGCIVGALVILLAGTAILVAYTFDPAWAKQELTRTIKEQKQRQLSIEGDISLSFFPSLGVRLGKTRLSEFQSDQEFAGLDSARVSVRLLPLLSKQLVVDQIDLTNVRANIVRNKNGTFNFEDLLNQKSDPANSAVKFDIAGIRMTGEIRYRDELTGRQFKLSQIALQTGHLSNVSKGTLNFSGKFEEQANALTLDLKSDYDINLEPREFSLSGIQGQIQGEAAGFKPIALDLETRKLSLALGKNTLAVEGLKGQIKARLGEESLEVKLEAPDLSTAGDQVSGKGISGNFSLNGSKRQLNGKFTVSAAEGTLQAFRIAQAGLEWTAQQGPTSMRGQLSGPIQGNLKSPSLSLPKLSGLIEIEDPSMPMKRLKLPLSGTIQADFAKTSLAATLASHFDETTIQSSWNIPRFSPLSANFELDIDRLNLDKYLPPTPKTGSTPGNAPATPVKGTPIDLSALKGIDLKGTVRIGFLQFNNVKISQIKAFLQLANGRLDINPMAGQAYQGSLTGNLQANAQNNRFTLRQTMSNIAIGPLLRDVAQKDLLEGRGNITLDLSTTGKSVPAIQQALSGTASLQLRDGALKGINLAASLREFKAKFSGKQEAVQKARQGEKTDFSELSASFKIANGIARNDDFSAKSPFLRLAGSGTIDLVQSLLDYKTKVSIVGTSKGQEGKELDQLKGITVPLQISGPFDNLSYKLDFASLAGNLVQTKAKEEAQKQLEKKAGEKMGGALKGWFKK